MKKVGCYSKGLLFFLVLTVLLNAGPVYALKNLTIASGKSGGVWYPMGGFAAYIFQNKLDGYKVMVMQGTGDANIIGVNDNKYTMGICFSFAAADARFGLTRFNQPMTNIAGMAALYSSPLQIVVRGDSDIKTIRDLKGKRIAPGLKGTSGEVLMKNILRVHGLGYMDMARVEHLAYSDAADKMKKRGDRRFYAFYRFSFPGDSGYRPSHGRRSPAFKLEPVHIRGT